jgi:hypothetical protein
MGLTLVKPVAMVTHDRGKLLRLLANSEVGVPILLAHMFSRLMIPYPTYRESSTYVQDILTALTTAHPVNTAQQRTGRLVPGLEAGDPAEETGHSDTCAIQFKKV